MLTERVETGKGAIARRARATTDESRDDDDDEPSYSSSPARGLKWFFSSTASSSCTHRPSQSCSKRERERARTHLSHPVDRVGRNQDVRLVQVGNQETLARPFLLIELQQDLLDRRVAAGESRGRQRERLGATLPSAERGRTRLRGRLRATETVSESSRVTSAGSDAPLVAFTMPTCASRGERSATSQHADGARRLRLSRSQNLLELSM